MKFICIISCIGVLYSCSTSKKLSKKADAFVLQDSALLNANIGISIYDPATNTYLYNHNANKYFVPASNTKIFTCYAAMKYLGDSLIGLKYEDSGDTLKIVGTGDPTFLLEEYKQQPVAKFLQQTIKPILLTTQNWQEEKWGSGWNWTDFGEDYCQERSALPMYYNTVTFTSKYFGSYVNGYNIESFPKYFDKLLNKNLVNLNTNLLNAQISKSLDNNTFALIPSAQKFSSTNLSFSTDKTTLVSLLREQFNKNVFNSENRNSKIEIPKSKIFTQPTDSVLKPMMHRSDNFFAEQLLLMVSNEKLGYMNDVAIIDYIKKNDFVGIPQIPRWVDGSGLSRYNMFTPQSIIFVLQKMQQEFGMERIKKIFATGGQGTLASYYKTIPGLIFAKTGTLSNHAALSGFLYTKKGKLLLFSTLTSGYQGSATPVRKAVEKLLLYIQQQY